MLSLILKAPGNYADPLTKDIEWHIGEELSGRACDDLEKYSFQCVLAQADGHELEYLWLSFQGIPFAFADGISASGERNLAAVHKWRGEWAQFIFDHLPRKW